MNTASQVAKYFLCLAADDTTGDTISNLKLQKLLYYAQGYHLAIFGKPIFSDSVEAWTHGPVVPGVYRDYKSFGTQSIDAPEEFDLEVFSKDDQEFLNEVYTTVGQFSAWKLRNMTHEEPPWKDAIPTRGGGLITQDEMQKYFVTLVTEDEED